MTTAVDDAGRPVRDRRSVILQLLRDNDGGVSVEQAAEHAGIHLNTARFHLEALVEAGQAVRDTEARGKPGRRRVLYSSTTLNHEPVQGNRLLVSMLMAAFVTSCPDAGRVAYRVGTEWGRFLTSRPAPFETFDEHDIAARLVDKVDSAWFAPEYCESPSPELRLHNCPFLEAALRTPEVICEMHAGMIDGSLGELRSRQHVSELHPQEWPHLCRAKLGPLVGEPPVIVPLVLAGSATT